MPEIKTPVTSKFFYRKMGSGPAVVLIHGFPESSALWRNIWDDLATSYTLLIPDLPGSGSTPLEQETYIPQMADCISLMLDTECVTKAVIAGHSMGGYVGFEFASRYSERLAGLSIVHSTPLADDEEKKSIRLRSISLIEKGGKNAFVRQMVPNLFSDGFKQSHAAIVEEQSELALQIEAKSLVNYTKAMIARPDHSSLPETAVYPIQWILGTEDKIILYKKILTYCAKSGINFVTFYNNCGHMSMLEAPDKLINDLRKFINYCYERLH